MMWIKSFFCLYFLALFFRVLFQRKQNFVFSLSTFGITAAGVATAVSYGTAAYGAYNAISGAIRGGGKRGGGGGGGGMDLPSFWSDPYLGKTQDYMYGYGTELLEGKPNDYYKPLGEVGGSMFEDYLSKVNRDTTRATEEGAIRRGMAHGGAVDSAITKNVSDVSSKMRWEDFLRAMEGRTNFLKIGDSQVKQVGANALTNQDQRNAFEIDKARIASGLTSSGTTAGANAGQVERGGIVSAAEAGGGAAGDADWKKLISMIAGGNSGGKAEVPEYLSEAELIRANQNRGKYTI